MPLSGVDDHQAGMGTLLEISGNTARTESAAINARASRDASGDRLPLPDSSIPAEAVPAPAGS